MFAASMIGAKRAREDQHGISAAVLDLAANIRA
jgi:hypothetical protein